MDITLDDLTISLRKDITKQFPDALGQMFAIEEIARRGIQVTPTSQETSEIIKFFNKVNVNKMDKDFPKLTYNNDRRILLYSGYVKKKGTESLIKRNSTRYCVLFNDIFVICEEKKTKKKDNKDEYNIEYILSHVIKIEDIAIVDLEYTTITDNNNNKNNKNNDEEYSFELRSKHENGRSYILICETLEMKMEWIKELTMSWLAICIDQGIHLTIGSHHDFVLGNWYSAAYNGNVDVMETLYNRKREDEMVLNNDLTEDDDFSFIVEEKDDMGISAIHYAVVANQTNVIEFLLGKGCDPNLTTDKMSTPLHLSAKYGTFNAMIELVKFGADSNLLDINSETALYLAVIHGENNRDANNMISLLHSTGAALDCIDEKFSNPLHKCAELGLVHMAQILINLGLNVNTLRSSDDFSPLHIACQAEIPNVEMIDLLCDDGCYVNASTMKSIKPLQVLIGEKYFDIGDIDEANNKNIIRPSYQMTEEDRDDLFMNLPLMISIIKHGGRLDLSSLCSAGVSDDVLESLEYNLKLWQVKSEPKEFATEFQLEKLKVSKSNWIDDKASNNLCILCQGNFTMLFRKHHCRMCGVLVCNNCSSKTLSFDKEENTKLSALKSIRSSGNMKAERVCDSCFNVIYCKIENKLDAAGDLEAYQKQLEDTTKAKLHTQMQNTDRKKLGLKDNENSGGIGEVSKKMSENKNLALENLEKARRIANATEDVQNEAQEFRDNATKLRKAMEKKNKGWFGF